MSLIHILGIQDIVKNTRCLCITSPELSTLQVRNYQKACSLAGFSREKYMLMDYGESFYYYALGQKRETWNRSVGWYAFAGDTVTFRKLTINGSSRPVLVKLEDPVSTKLEPEEEIRDVEFYRFISKTLGKELFSSVQITGEGFEMCIRDRQKHIVEDLGIPKENIFILSSGNVLELDGQDAKVTGSVHTGAIFVDGLGVGDVGNIVLRDRQHLSEDGIMIVVMTLERHSNVVLSLIHI